MSPSLLVATMCLLTIVAIYFWWVRKPAADAAGRDGRS